MLREARECELDNQEIVLKVQRSHNNNTSKDKNARYQRFVTSSSVAGEVVPSDHVTVAFKMKASERKLAATCCLFHGGFFLFAFCLYYFHLPLFTLTPVA